MLVSVIESPEQVLVNNGIHLIVLSDINAVNETLQLRVYQKQEACVQG